MSAPSDLSTENATLRRALDTKAQEIAARDQVIAQLRHNLEVLRRMLFGPQSEKRGPALSDAEGQQLLALGELAAQAEAAATAQDAKAKVEVTPGTEKPKKAGRRSTFPAHLPVVRERIEVPEALRRCACGHWMKGMGRKSHASSSGSRSRWCTRLHA